VGPIPSSLASLLSEPLKPPLRLIVVAPPGFMLPRKSQYPETFDSIDAAYAFFRQIRPEGRWILWLQGADGALIGADSKMWERGPEERAKPLQSTP